MSWRTFQQLELHTHTHYKVITNWLNIDKNRLGCIIYRQAFIHKEEPLHLMCIMLHLFFFLTLPALTTILIWLSADFFFFFYKQHRMYSVVFML